MFQSYFFEIIFFINSEVFKGRIICYIKCFQFVNLRGFDYCGHFYTHIGKYPLVNGKIYVVFLKYLVTAWQILNIFNNNFYIVDCATKILKLNKFDSLIIIFCFEMGTECALMKIKLHWKTDPEINWTKINNSTLLVLISLYPRRFCHVEASPVRKFFLKERPLPEPYT